VVELDAEDDDGRVKFDDAEDRLEFE